MSSKRGSTVHEAYPNVPVVVAVSMFFFFEVLFESVQSANKPICHQRSHVTLFFLISEKGSL